MIHGAGATYLYTGITDGPTDIRTVSDSWSYSGKFAALVVGRQMRADLGLSVGDRLGWCRLEIRRFLWAGTNELTGEKCKVVWSTVAKPIEYGGLGIIELQAFSRALRVRWLWFQWSNPERP